MVNREQRRAAARRKPSHDATPPKPRRGAESDQPRWTWAFALSSFLPGAYAEARMPLIGHWSHREIALMVQEDLLSVSMSHSIEQCTAFVWELDMERFWSALRDAIAEVGWRETEVNTDGVADALGVTLDWLESVLMFWNAYSCPVESVFMYSDAQMMANRSKTRARASEMIGCMIRRKGRRRATNAYLDFTRDRGCNEWFVAYCKTKSSPDVWLAGFDWRMCAAQHRAWRALRERVLGVDHPDLVRGTAGAGFERRMREWAHDRGESPLEPDTTSTATPTLTK